MSDANQRKTKTERAARDARAMVVYHVSRVVKAHELTPAEESALWRQLEAIAYFRARKGTHL